MIVQNDMLEAFDDWLDDVDELSEERNGLDAVLSADDLKVLGGIKKALHRLLSEEILGVGLPVLHSTRPLIQYLIARIQGWCMGVFADQVNEEVFVCINDIHGKLVHLLPEGTG